MPKKLSLKEFIDKAQLIHKNKYDYSLVDYKHSSLQVKIICSEHGIFEQRPNFHLQGSNCPQCGKVARIKNRWLPYLTFISNAKVIHKNFYEYTENFYQGTNKKVKILCPTHGEFSQTGNQHLLGQGCPKCSGNIPYSTSSFIKKASKVHKNKYDYSLVEYKNSHSKIKIICSKHGIFEQLAYHHLQGHSCSKCFTQNKISKGEKEVLSYIKSIYFGKIIENDRKVLKGKELDIFLPELKIGIEYNGEYWHKLYKTKKPGYHKIKKELCQQNNITLINILDREWKDNKEMVKELISNILRKYHLDSYNLD